MSNIVSNNELSILGILHQTWRLLNKERKKQYLALVILIFISSILEIASIGSIIPLIKGIGDPESFYVNFIASTFFASFVNNEASSVIISIGLVFATVSISSATLKIFVIFCTSKIAFKSGADITQKIYNGSINRPYAYYQSLKSNELIDVISGKVNSLINSVIIPCLYLVNSLIMSLVIVSGIIYIDYKVAITIFLLYGSLYLSILLLTKKTLSENSRVISKNSSELIKLTQIALGGIRNIIIDQNRSVFINKFNEVNQKLRSAQANSVFIGNSPKNILEAFAIVLISVIAIVKTNSSEPPATIIAVIGVIALAAQRLLPLMQQAFSAWTSFRENKYSVIEILKYVNFEGDFEQHASNIKFEKSIQLECISYKYQFRDKKILNNFSLKILKGEKIAITGKTGSGKSTLIDIFLGLIRPNFGRVLIDDVGCEIYNNRVWHDKVGHVPQNIYLFDGSVTENIVFGQSCAKIDYDRLHKVCDLAEVSEFVNKMPDGFSSLIGEGGSLLSGGQRQRIGIARALYKEAEILVFDEAMSALDHETERKILNSIKEFYPSVTIISVTHNSTTIDAYDRSLKLEGQ